MANKFIPLESPAINGGDNTYRNGGVKIPSFLTGFTAAQKLINGAANIFLATHEEPDGDAVGSMLALKMALEKMGKRAIAFCATPIAGEFQFLPRVGQIEQRFDLNNIDLIIGLDYGDFGRLRLGRLEELDQFNFLTLDHHLAGNYLGLQIVEPSYSSTAEIVYHFLKFLGVSLNPLIATCLLAGIFDDTGGFRYSNTSAQTLKIAGELLAGGASLIKVASSMSGNNFEIKMETWRQIFDFLEMDEQSGIIYSLVSYENLHNRQKYFHTSVIANILNSVPEAKLALILLEKEPGCFDGSLRSRQDQQVDVAKIAQAFGGGGHRLAAGFKSNAGPKEIIGKIKSFLAAGNCR